MPILIFLPQRSPRAGSRTGVGSGADAKCAKVSGSYAEEDHYTAARCVYGRAFNVSENEVVMVRSILEIGNAKYRIDRGTLRRFMREARQSTWPREGSGEVCDAAAAPCGESLEQVFNEVMGLYNEYAVTGRMEALMKLKSKLEQVSLRYKSLTLAEEVLNINSCLPYEWRVGNLQRRD